jgi:hypothetical protein
MEEFKLHAGLVIQSQQLASLAAVESYLCFSNILDRSCGGQTYPACTALRGSST